MDIRIAILGSLLVIVICLVVGSVIVYLVPPRYRCCIPSSPMRDMCNDMKNTNSSTRSTHLPSIEEEHTEVALSGDEDCIRVADMDPESLNNRTNRDHSVAANQRRVEAMMHSLWSYGLVRHYKLPSDDEEAINNPENAHSM